MKQHGLTAVLVIACTIFVFTGAIGQTRSGKLGVGIDVSGQYVLGAGSTTSGVGPGGGISLFYSPWEYIGLRSNLVYNQLSWTAFNSNASRSATTDVMSGNFYLSFDMAPRSSFNPFIFGGGGVALLDPKNENTGYRALGPSNFDIHYSGGIGADYFLNEFWSVTLMGEYVLTNAKNYVGANSATLATGNDSFARVSLQVRYYLFDENFITKLLKAQRDRLKSGK